MNRDTTTRALHELEQQCAMLMANTEECFVLIDPALNIVTFNNKFERLYLEYFGKIVRKGEPILNYVIPERRDMLENLYKYVLQGNTHHTELEFNLADGSTCILKNDFKPVYDDKGKMVGVFVSSSDVTQQVLAVRELKQSEERYRSIFNHNPIPVIICDLETLDILEVNEAAVQKYGYTSDEFVRKKFRDIYSPEDHTGLEKTLKKEETSGSITTSVWRHLDSTGSQIYMELSGTFIEYKDRKCLLALLNDVTDKLKAEEKIKESHELLKKLTDNLPAAIYQFEITPDYKMSFPFVSNGIERLLPGIEVNEIQNNALYAFNKVHPEDLETVMNSIKASAAKLTEWNVEFRTIDKKGVVRWNRASSIPEKRRDGTYTWYGYIMEITEQVKAEKRLRESEEGLRLILNSAHDAIVSMDTEGKIIFWNPQAEQIFGWTEKEILGKRLSSKIIPRRYREGHDTGMNRYMESGETHMMNRLVETTAINKAGVEFPVELTIVPVQGRDSFFFTGFIRDISSRTENERFLKESHERITLSLNELRHQKFALDQHSIVAVTDSRGNIEYVNDKFCAISQYSQEELLGQNHRIINSGYHPRAFFKDLYTTITSGNVWHGEICNRAKDGSLYWVYTSIVPYVNEKTGKPEQYIAIRTDITRRKQDEARLKELNEQLQQRAEELANSNTELENFAYVASHDLQEPLRMVGSYVELLEKRYADQLDEDGKTFIHFAVDGATRMKRLINDLLDYSRLKRELKFTQVDMNRVMKEVLHTLNNRIEETGASIKTDTLPEVRADKTQMVQLLQNLISNALKYHRSGVPPKIIIQAKKQPGFWCFSVSDNGIGIDKKYADHIFVIFKQLHTKDKYGGTGIGLAIVKRIAQAHGGKVWIKSTPGKGTIFYFTVMDN